MNLLGYLIWGKISSVGKTLFDIKGAVSSTSDLPLTDNKKGDVWIVSSDNSEWVWVSDNSSGTLSDYEELGPVIDLSGYQTKITASGILKGDGNGGVSAAEAGTDYGTYSKPSGGIPSSDFDASTQAQLLPDVTNVDNGKFARVVNGAWAAVTVPEAAGGDF